MSRKPTSRKSKSRFGSDLPGSAGPVTLSQVLPGARFIACDEISASRLRDDADACEPGDLFVARATPAGDGHEHVNRAIANGAAGIVAERIVPTGGVPLAIVSDSNRAFGLLAQALAGDPSAGMRLIAVTGTSGKTSVAVFTQQIWSRLGRAAAALGTTGTQPPIRTSPVTPRVDRIGDQSWSWSSRCTNR
jgi:UDP-N-acetylmuramyl tripeptide synthase